MLAPLLIVLGRQTKKQTDRILSPAAVEELRVIETMAEKANEMLARAVDGFAQTPVPKMFFAELERARELLQDNKVGSARRLINDARTNFRFIELNHLTKGVEFIAN